MIAFADLNNNNMSSNVPATNKRKREDPTTTDNNDATEEETQTQKSRRIWTEEYGRIHTDNYIATQVKIKAAAKKAMTNPVAFKQLHDDYATHYVTAITNLKAAEFVVAVYFETLCMLEMQTMVNMFPLIDSALQQQQLNLHNNNNNETTTADIINFGHNSDAVTRISARHATESDRNFSVHMRKYKNRFRMASIDPHAIRFVVEVHFEILRLKQLQKIAMRMMDNANANGQEQQ
jgi:hypothetical protein